MSNSKSNNGNGRQMTLPQMTLALTNNKTSVNNGTNKKKSSIKSTSSNTNKKQPQIHEIINLEQEDFIPNNQFNILQGKNEQAFVHIGIIIQKVGELAKKCGAFFNWINQVDYSILGEQLWKNKMMQLVGERFPELTTQQQQKLIERDWKIMAPERKQKILKQMLSEVSYQQIDNEVNEKFEQQRNVIYTSYGPKENMIAE